MNDFLSTWISSGSIYSSHNTHSPSHFVTQRAHLQQTQQPQRFKTIQYRQSMSRPNPEQTSKIDQTLYPCRQRRSENTLITETPPHSLLVNKRTLFPLTSSPNGISLIAQQRTPFFTPSITPSSPIVSIRMTALTPTAIPDHAQHPPAAPLLLHMVLSHPPPSTVIEICTFNFEHFHESISFPCSPARFPPPTRFFLFTSHCFHSIHSLQRIHSNPANPLHSLHQQRCNNDATAMQPPTRFRSQPLLLTSRMHTAAALCDISSLKHFTLPYMAQLHSHALNAIENGLF